MALIFATLLIIVIIILVIYAKKEYDDVTYVKSDIDNKYYLVRRLQDKQMASNLLAKIKENMITLTMYLTNNKNKYPEQKQYIEQLDDKIHNSIITESSENNVYTSYSVNKGEQIVFCLRSRKEKNQLHDINLLMYVVLHEMAHVACPEYGHTNLFKNIFAFFTTIAIEQKLYTKINFREHPLEYCGISITDSII
jgi:hypothetical protein